MNQLFLHVLRSASKNYHLAMHVFGLLTTATTLEDLDDMVQSAAVVFSSPSSGANVEKHFQNIQSWLQKKGVQLDETAPKSQRNADDFQVNGNICCVKTFAQFGRHV